jgi:hypothetical protein
MGRDSPIPPDANRKEGILLFLSSWHIFEWSAYSCGCDSLRNSLLLSYTNNHSQAYACEVMVESQWFMQPLSGCLKLLQLHEIRERAVFQQKCWAAQNFRVTVLKSCSSNINVLQATYTNATPCALRGVLGREMSSNRHTASKSSSPRVSSFSLLEVLGFYSIHFHPPLPFYY